MRIPRSLLLSSGGLDSAVVAAMNKPAVHLFVNYKQLNATREQWASTAIAEYYGAEKVTLHCAPFGNSPLTSPGQDLAVPVVPGRNLVLISLAISVALQHDCEFVLIGTNADDVRNGFADCSVKFMAAADLVASTYGVMVRAPLSYLDKTSIGYKAAEKAVPTELTWSCYRDGMYHCGDCGACATRAVALGVANH